MVGGVLFAQVFSPRHSVGRITAETSPLLLSWHGSSLVFSSCWRCCRSAIVFGSTSVYIPTSSLFFLHLLKMAKERRLSVAPAHETSKKRPCSMKMACVVRCTGRRIPDIKILARNGARHIRGPSFSCVCMRVCVSVKLACLPRSRISFWWTRLLLRGGMTVSPLSFCIRPRPLRTASSARMICPLFPHRYLLESVT